MVTRLPGALSGGQACPDTTVVGVGDREAEIYELVLAAVQARAAGLPRAEILVRAMCE